MSKKRTDKQYVAGLFLLHNKAHHYQALPNFRILSQVVAEKSLTEKSSLEGKRNEQIKGLISNIWLFLVHTITHHYQALYQISES